MTQSLYTHTYENGLTLIAESMPWLESAAFLIAPPGGCIHDPAGVEGLGNFTSEMVMRGCGSRDSRTFVQDLNNLGVNFFSAMGVEHVSFGAAMPAAQLESALAIFADLIQRPLLPESQLEDARQVCWQEIRSTEDDFGQKVMQAIREAFYPGPFGRSHQGTQSSVARIGYDDIKSHFTSTYASQNAVMSVAGKIEWERLRDHIGELFSDWNRSSPTEPEITEPTFGYTHIEAATSQTHIALAWECPPYKDANYFQARGAVGVLSDGMSSRLFTEVREKRGLVYSVGASCDSLPDQAGVFCYAGSTTDRAQETLNVILAELKNLESGVHEDELKRLKAQMKTSLVMEQESSRARCSALASDWRHLGRVRTREEINNIVDGLSCASINTWLNENPPQNFTIATVGEAELETPDGIS